MRKGSHGLWILKEYHEVVITSSQGVITKKQTSSLPGLNLSSTRVEFALQACAPSAHSVASMRNFEFRAGKSVKFGAGSRRHPQRRPAGILPTFLRASVFLNRRTLPCPYHGNIQLKIELSPPTLSRSHLDHPLRTRIQDTKRTLHRHASISSNPEYPRRPAARDDAKQGGTLHREKKAHGG